MVDVRIVASSSSFARPTSGPSPPLGLGLHVYLSKAKARQRLDVVPVLQRTASNCRSRVRAEPAEPLSSAQVPLPSVAAVLRCQCFADWALRPEGRPRRAQRTKTQELFLALLPAQPLLLSGRRGCAVSCGAHLDCMRQSASPCKPSPSDTSEDRVTAPELPTQLVQLPGSASTCKQKKYYLTGVTLWHSALCAVRCALCAVRCAQAEVTTFVAWLLGVPDPRDVRLASGAALGGQVVFGNLNYVATTEQPRAQGLAEPCCLGAKERKALQTNTAPLFLPMRFSQYVNMDVLPEAALSVLCARWLHVQSR